jgi:hypothetical protein
MQEALDEKHAWPTLAESMQQSPRKSPLKKKQQKQQKQQTASMISLETAWALSQQQTMPLGHSLCVIEASPRSASPLKPDVSSKVGAHTPSNLYQEAADGLPEALRVALGWRGVPPPHSPLPSAAKEFAAAMQDAVIEHEKQQDQLDQQQMEAEAQLSAIQEVVLEEPVMAPEEACHITTTVLPGFMFSSTCSAPPPSEPEHQEQKLHPEVMLMPTLSSEDRDSSLPLPQQLQQHSPARTSLFPQRQHSPTRMSLSLLVADKSALLREQQRSQQEISPSRLGLLVVREIRVDELPTLAHCMVLAPHISHQSAHTPPSLLPPISPCRLTRM